MTLLTRCLTWLWLLAGSSAGAAGPDDETVRRTLAGVFDRSEFDESPRGLDLRRMLAELFAWLGSLLDAAPGLFWLLLLGCLLLLGLLVGHLVWTVCSALSWNRRRKGEEHVQRRRRLSASFAAAAEKAAADGDYTEAVRCLFLCLVHHFDESGRLSFLPSGTNREYLEQFVGRPTVHADLAVFVETLDHDWYGQRPTPPEQYRRCRDLFDRVYGWA